MSPDPKGQTACTARLAAGVSLLTPVLEPCGFRFEPFETGSASGGPFASGFFSHESLRIGLIVRESGMGGVNYEHGDLLAGHDGLLTALDVASAGRLTFDRDAWCSVSKTGGDPFEALAADLNDLVLPVLIGEPKRFNLALAQAHRAHLRSLGFDSAAAP